MGWRDFRKSTLVEKMEKMEKIPADAEQIPFIPLIPPTGDSNFTGSLSPERLTDAEQEAYQQYVEIMTSSKFNLPMDQAEQEAMRLVMRAKQALQARQTAKDYKRDGFIKIYSTVLNRAVYMAKRLNGFLDRGKNRQRPGRNDQPEQEQEFFLEDVPTALQR